MLYYVFDEEVTAVGAENAISQIGGVPITGVNAKTGAPEPDKCKTERWAIPKERLDGKWVFPYVGDERVAAYGEATENYFNNMFPYTLEEYDEAWFPVEEYYN